MNWLELAERVLNGNAPSREEALAVLRSPESDVPSILDAAYRIRRHHHGNKVKVHILLNAKMGGCPEDCGFCSQSAHYETPVDRHKLMTREEILEQARAAADSGAWKFCIVTATRGPSDKDLEVICGAVEEIKRTLKINVCTSLGTLTPDKARRLKEAGVDKFNHNLETAERHFPDVVGTHTYQDRVSTVKIAKQAGMEACCGGIIGMGESDEDVVDLAFALRELGVESIPVNFLDPRPGTPMQSQGRLTPTYCLKTLAMFRFVNPSRDIRAAGGREVNLRSLQPLALYAANSIFTNGYLTTPGNDENADIRMIRDMGFEVLLPEGNGQPVVGFARVDQLEAG
ncbi:MAG: biotin synthase BioB [Nitrospirae bacterium]|nr:biotin synthase BioB [Nitrospirota bacterium]